MSVSLCFVLALSAAAPQDPGPTTSPVVTQVADAPHGQTVVGAADAEVQEPDSGFWAKYFPWWLDEKLHPKVEENLFWLWVSNVLPGGFLWAPYILLGELPGEQYYVEASFAFVLHVLFMSPVALVAIIPILGIIVLYGWMGTNYVILMPVASINALNRAMKRLDAKRRAKPRLGALDAPLSSRTAAAMAF